MPDAPERWYCPHCATALRDVPLSLAPPATSLKCPACRLLVAPGRAVTLASARLIDTGTASGVLQRAAKRDETGRELDVETVHEALRIAADLVGVRVSRLRMLDYDDLLARGLLPDVRVADILATHPSWKAACRAADEDLDDQPEALVLD